jgi:SAM-dependent methyltransferase
VPHLPIGKENDFDYIRKSFSREWGIFDYDTDKTWGWTLDERKRVFLSDVGFAESELKGKLLLDAGCGNGTLTAALSTFGLEVVGMDLSDGLGDANLRKNRQAGKFTTSVHFVQANLFQPPLTHGSFDLIYCSGVIHHTPNSKETFERLVPLVRTGGRLYVWVYGRRALPVRIFFGFGRQLKRFMSLESLMTICRIVAPVYKVGTEVLNSLGIAEFRGRTSREITLDLFDAWAPKYNHWHTEDEVQSWFHEMGFTNITIAGRQKHGFGCYGDKVQPLCQAAVEIPDVESRNRSL